jgi:hypothetical protein
MMDDTKSLRAPILFLRSRRLRLRRLTANLQTNVIALYPTF